MPSSNRVAKIVFATATCLVIALSYTLYKRVLDLDDSYREVNQNNLVKLKLERILSRLKDAETAQRGFLLTSDSAFLQPLYGAQARIGRLLSEVRQLTENNAEQQNNLNALETFIDVRFRAFETQIRQFNSPQESPTAKRLHLMSGQASMDLMRGHIQAIADMEDALMQKREDRKKLFRYMTPLFALTLIITILAILAFSYAKITQQLRKTRALLGQLRRLNRRLKQQNYELELYNKELDSFTYIASHDLKEPLRKVLTYTALVEESEGHRMTDRNQHYLQRIRHAARRMQNLLNDLLLYSHTSLAEKKFETVDLNLIMNEVQLNLQEEILDSDATILVKELPRVQGLAFQLKQLFENLVLNSIRYRKDDVPPVIRISSSLVPASQLDFPHKNSSRYFRILYSDNGIGFSQVHAEKIFELFRRIHQKSAGAGTGIGLTICKKIIQNHDGFVRAKSESGKGTTFEIYLPGDGRQIQEPEEEEVGFTDI